MSLSVKKTLPPRLFTVWLTLLVCKNKNRKKPSISPGYSVSKQSCQPASPRTPSAVPSLHGGSFVAPTSGHPLMAEHCHFISSFSLRIWVHACGGLDGPRTPAHTCSPQRTLGYRRSMLIYISPSQISLYIYIYICIKKKPMAALWGSVSSHFRDPRGQLQWWIYPLQSEAFTAVVSCTFLGYFIICYVQCVPICTTQEAAQATWIQIKSNCVYSIRYRLKFCFHYQNQTRFKSLEINDFPFSSCGKQTVSKKIYFGTIYASFKRKWTHTAKCKYSSR